MGRKAVYDLLAEHLSRAELRRLQRLSRRFRQELFQYREASGAFEVSEGFDWQWLATRQAEESTGLGYHGRSPARATTASYRTASPQDEEAVADLLSKCCDILTAHAGELDLSRLPVEHREEGDVTLRFHFHPHVTGGVGTDAGEGAAAHSGGRPGSGGVPWVPAAGAAVADRFVALLLLRANPAFRVLVATGRERLTVGVRFHYHSELEFSRYRDQVYWLLELAGRAVAGLPFRGFRL